ncbi:MAG: di-trans,poly-cis-decaprenylcistransferase [Alphaproteobacteria bacterium]|nr:di-trans,poly-cis-decaprenylcistransferase [Alphaproteobacteria bacterium]MBN2780050.1 di-trans,poly-cis-decaprenylcistransferase [Alphaproteobacteria bacterium]
MLKHIAIICDGNRRWAKEKGLPALKGHQEGANAVERLINAGLELNIPVMSFWVMGVDNFGRSKEEVSWLMKLSRIWIKKAFDKYTKKNIQFRLCGLRDKPAPKDVIDLFEKLENDTKNSTGLIVNICFNYGGHTELMDATKRIIADGLQPENITEETFEKYLWTDGLPHPDLILRTSGEQRLSGFMPWQSRYSEFYFPNYNFPEMNKEKLEEALKEFENRNRRFGKG